MLLYSCSFHFQSTWYECVCKEEHIEIENETATESGFPGSGSRIVTPVAASPPAAIGFSPSEKDKQLYDMTMAINFDDYDEQNLPDWFAWLATKKAQCGDSPSQIEQRQNVIRHILLRIFDLNQFKDGDVRTVKLKSFASTIFSGHFARPAEDICKEYATGKIAEDLTKAISAVGSNMMEKIV